MTWIEHNGYLYNVRKAQSILKYYSQSIRIVWNIDDHDDLNFDSESLRNIFFVDIKNKVINGRADSV